MSSTTVSGGGGWLATSPEQFRAAARALAATAQTNERTLNALDRAASELTAQADGWSGRPSRRFTATWTQRAEQLRGQIRVHRNAAAILDRFAAELHAAQQAYGWTGQRAAAIGATLTPDGQVVTGRAMDGRLPNPPPGWEQEAVALEREAVDVHHQVADADRHATTLLLALADRAVPRPEFSEGLPTLLQPGAGGSVRNAAATTGIDPTLAAAWFAALSPAVRDRLTRTAPNLVGSLDGVPPDARDQANRIRVRHELAAGSAALAAARRELAAGLPAGLAAPLRGHIAELEQHLARRDPTLNGLLAGDRQLLSFDNRGEGRAVVATGDITRARNVAVMVAGRGTTIDNLGTTVGDGDRLRDEIRRSLGPAAAQDTAVVTWFGDAAPDGLHEAGSARFAERGMRALAQFTDGLRVVHEGDPHLTVIAHRHGSPAAGMAAAGTGVPAADDVVLIGRPGVTAHHPDRLQPGAGASVWTLPDGGDAFQDGSPSLRIIAMIVAGHPEAV